MNGLVWLRSDLRIDDNPALSIADNECEKIVCLYLLSEEEWNAHNNGNVKLDFIIRNLSNLSKDLKKLNIPLITASTKNFDSIPNQIAEFSKSNNISKCYWNNEFGVDEQERDQKVQNMLEISQIDYQFFDEQILFKPGTLLTGQGKPFSVFTPFKKKWIENFSIDHLEIESDISVKKNFNVMNTFNDEISFAQDHNVDMSLWPAGELAAKTRLENFLNHKVSNYSKDRNDPILEGTSRISPYLAVGVISTYNNIYIFTAHNFGVPFL